MVRLQKWVTVLVFPLSIFTLAGCTKDNWFFKIYHSLTHQINRTVASEDTSITEVDWEKPSNWISRPTSPMRRASFMVPSKDQDATKRGDVAVIILSGDGGGWENNVNHWREDLQLPALPLSEIEASTHRDTSSLGEFQWSEITSSSTGMLVAALSLPEKTLFVKLLAPLSTMSAQKDHFLEFCRSFKPKPPADDFNHPGL